MSIQRPGRHTADGGAASEATNDGAGYALARGEGRALWTLGGLMTIKAAGAHTRDRFAVVERVLPVDFRTPPHVHELEDEALYVLEGDLLVTCGPHTWGVTSGAFVFLPRGVSHSFNVTGDASAHILVIASPAGYEEFAAEVGRPAIMPDLPPLGAPDADRQRIVAMKYRIQV